MDLILDGLAQAIALIVGLDPEIIRIGSLTMAVSGTATIISLLIGVPLGFTLGVNDFPGRSFLISIVNTGMGLPPVVVGLFVTIMLWRNGPLGLLHLLYTPTAMIIAQCVIATPIIIGFTMAGVGQLDPRFRTQMLGLGASNGQMVWLMLLEARLPILAAVMAGFGAIISEVGASMMVGGNIQGQTRVLTTATVMETAKGNFALAIALSIILLVLTYLVNLFLTMVQQRGRAS